MAETPDQAVKTPRKHDVLYYLRNFDFYIAAISLAALIFLTVGGVFMRYAVAKPFTWLEEVQLWLMVWVVFLGASAVARTSGHIAIDAFVGLFPRALRLAAVSITQVVTIFVLGFLGYYAYRHTQQMYTSERVTNIIHFPYYIIYAAVPLSCLLISITCLRNLVRVLRGQPTLVQEID